jgi:8-oxo-dGTP pyrophosphatase MutT (NUDIX family)
MNITKDGSHKILTGNWGEDITWEFYVSNEMPSIELCTSVMCVAMAGPNEFVLTHNHRGWELPGGHIESGESIEDTLLRELKEEAGFNPETYKLFGYRKLTTRVPIPHAQQEGFYPFPVSYIPYYAALSSLPLITPTGDPAEILGAQVFSLNEIGSVREEFMQIATVGQEVVADL